MKMIVASRTPDGLALHLPKASTQRDVAFAGNYREGPTAQRPSTRRTLTMAWIARCILIPASESQKTFLLVICDSEAGIRMQRAIQAMVRVLLVLGRCAVGPSR